MDIRKKIRQMGWKKVILSMLAGYLFLSIVFEFSAYHFISASVDKGFSHIHSKMDKEQKFREEGYSLMDKWSAETDAVFDRVFSEERNREKQDTIRWEEAKKSEKGDRHGV